MQPLARALYGPCSSFSHLTYGGNRLLPVSRPRHAIREVLEPSVIEPCIRSVPGQELLVGAHFYDPAPLQHDDGMGTLYGVEVMGDHERRSVGHESIECLQYKVLGFHIQTYGRLV